MMEGIGNIGNDNMQSVVVVQTFWHDKQDISKHHKDNKDFTELVKKVCTLFICVFLRNGLCCIVICNLNVINLIHKQDTK